ncbi:hypothetical protein DFH09DRAFT_1333630 [Mycena vulgaris]|nr:hypothetical protein DFH09DRAFT_1333630 [Mycena vulgaris]
MAPAYSVPARMPATRPPLSTRPTRCLPAMRAHWLHGPRARCPPAPHTRWLPAPRVTHVPATRPALACPLATHAGYPPHALITCVLLVLAARLPRTLAARPHPACSLPAHTLACPPATHARWLPAPRAAHAPRPTR